MATVEEIVKDIKSFAPSGISGIAIAGWINSRYQELLSKIHFRHMRTVGEVNLEAVIDTGTITTTRGSATVTGSSTTWTTAPGSGAQDDYFLQGASAWYRIASVGGDTTITLDSEWAEDALSGASYKIIKRYYSLAADARWLGNFVLSRIKSNLSLISPQEMNISFPGRIHTGSYPAYVSLVGIDSSGYLQAEFYPYPEETEIIRYDYWKIPTALTIASTIPAQIDSYVIKEGAMIDVYRAAKIAEIGQGNPEAAGVYANEEQKQRVIWRKALQDLYRTANAVEDRSVILRGFGGGHKTYEVVDAEDFSHMAGYGA